MDVSSTQSFTFHRYFNLRQITLPVVNLGTADTSGLVADPYQKGVLYRPGTVNPLPSQPADAQAVHNINRGYYGSVQATPQPTQVVNDQASLGAAAVDRGEIVIKLPQDSSGHQAAQAPAQLPVINLGNADTSGLVVDPRSGVSYRPGVVNIDPAQPAGTPEVHNINWGGYGSVQATPQPTQIVDDHYSTFSTTNSAEIFITPANGASATGSAELTSTNSSIAQSNVLQTKGETIDTKA